MTIQLLHFADVHVGMENYGKTDPATGLSSRVMDFVHRMDDMIDLVRERDVDLAIFAGDAFKTRNPNPTFQREFANRILDLADICPVVLLVGNHDLPTNIHRATTIDIFETLRVKNVIVGWDYDLHHIETKAGPVQVATAPYPVRQRLLEEDSVRGRSIADLDLLLQDELAFRLDRLAEMASVSDVPRVLAGHFTISGAVTGSERQVMLGRDIAAALSSVANPVWDYVAMGHIHKYQDLTKDNEGQPPVVYSGSMERIDFGEEGDDKGVVFVELRRGSTTYAFTPLNNVRPFITLRVDVRVASSPMGQILEAINQYDLTDAIVRLIIQTTPETDAFINHKPIEDALMKRGANIIAAIQREVERPERSRLGANPEGLTPKELLERYFHSLDVSPEQSARLVEVAEEIFKAVDDRLL